MVVCRSYADRHCREALTPAEALQKSFDLAVDGEEGAVYSALSHHGDHAVEFFAKKTRKSSKDRAVFGVLLRLIMRVPFEAVADDVEERAFSALNTGEMDLIPDKVDGSTERSSHRVVKDDQVYCVWTCGRRLV